MSSGATATSAVDAMHRSLGVSDVGLTLYNALCCRATPHVSACRPSEEAIGAVTRLLTSRCHADPVATAGAATTCGLLNTSRHPFLMLRLLVALHA